MANDELGRIGCECGATASVYQAKRKGAHLYSRCPACGLDQRTGARVQARLYWLTDWNGGQKPARPENVGEARPDWLDKPAGEPKKEPNRKPKKEPKGPDFDPNEQTGNRSAASVEEPENKPTGGLKVLAGLGMVVAALGVMAWKL